ncbi:MAG: type II toxin-antitoxin system PemK/MazF family toxin, partial [Casimicrobiaceae bacterium]
MTFERFTVVRVPFPFTDRNTSKNRAALVLSDASRFNSLSGHSVMAMITTQSHPPWPFDCPIRDLQADGQPAPSRVRLKL